MCGGEWSGNEGLIINVENIPLTTTNDVTNHYERPKWLVI